MLFARDIEDVKEFVLELIDKALVEDKEVVPEDIEMMNNISEYIKSGEMLYKEMARYLNDLLQVNLTRELNEKSSYGEIIEDVSIHHIDVLSIYSDAWAIYCRPGTYRIRL